MADIRALHEKPPVDAGLIAELRARLADAEAGRLCAFVGIADYHDGMVDYITAGIADWWAMSARLVDLSREVTLEDDED